MRCSTAPEEPGLFSKTEPLFSSFETEGFSKAALCRSSFSLTTTAFFAPSSVLRASKDGLCRQSIPCVPVFFDFSAEGGIFSAEDAIVRFCSALSVWSVPLKIPSSVLSMLPVDMAFSSLACGVFDMPLKACGYVFSTFRKRPDSSPWARCSCSAFGSAPSEPLSSDPKMRFLKAVSSSSAG